MWTSQIVNPMIKTQKIHSAKGLSKPAALKTRPCRERTENFGDPLLSVALGGFYLTQLPSDLLDNH